MKFYYVVLASLLGASYAEIALTAQSEIDEVNGLPVRISSNNTLELIASSSDPIFQGYFQNGALKLSPKVGAGTQGSSIAVGPDGQLLVSNTSSTTLFYDHSGWLEYDNEPIFGLLQTAHGYSIYVNRPDLEDLGPLFLQLAEVTYGDANGNPIPSSTTTSASTSTSPSASVTTLSMSSNTYLNPDPNAYGRPDGVAHSHADGANLKKRLYIPGNQFDNVGPWVTDKTLLGTATYNTDWVLATGPPQGQGVNQGYVGQGRVVTQYITTTATETVTEDGYPNETFPWDSIPTGETYPWDAPPATTPTAETYPWDTAPTTATYPWDTTSTAETYPWDSSSTTGSTETSPLNGGSTSAQTPRSTLPISTVVTPTSLRSTLPISTVVAPTSPRSTLPISTVVGPTSPAPIPSSNRQPTEKSSSSPLRFPPRSSTVRRGSSAAVTETFPWDSSPTRSRETSSRRSIRSPVRSRTTSSEIFPWDGTPATSSVASKSSSVAIAASMIVSPVVQPSIVAPAAVLPSIVTPSVVGASATRSTSVGSPRTPPSPASSRAPTTVDSVRITSAISVASRAPSPVSTSH